MSWLLELTSSWTLWSKGRRYESEIRVCRLTANVEEEDPLVKSANAENQAKCGTIQSMRSSRWQIGFGHCRVGAVGVDTSPNGQDNFILYSRLFCHVSTKICWYSRAVGTMGRSAALLALHSISPLKAINIKIIQNLCLSWTLNVFWSCFSIVCLNIQEEINTNATAISQHPIHSEQQLLVQCSFLFPTEQLSERSSKVSREGSVQQWVNGRVGVSEPESDHVHGVCYAVRHHTQRVSLKIRF